MKSPRRQGTQCQQLPPNQPTVTRSPPASPCPRRRHRVRRCVRRPRARGRAGTAYRACRRRRRGRRCGRPRKPPRRCARDGSPGGAARVRRSRRIRSRWVPARLGKCSWRDSGAGSGSPRGRFDAARAARTPWTAGTDCALQLGWDREEFGRAPDRRDRGPTDGGRLGGGRAPPGVTSSRVARKSVSIPPPLCGRGNTGRPGPDHGRRGPRPAHTPAAGPGACVSSRARCCRRRRPRSSCAAVRRPVP